MGRYRLARLAAIVSIVVCASWVSAAPRRPPELDALIARIGDRVAEYYQRAQSVMCVEHSTVQPVRSNWMPEGFARTVESDLRIEAAILDGDTFLKPTVIRDVRRINGREPRERDKTDRAGCTDPTPWSPEPLAFLLPTHRDEYEFTSIRHGKEQDRAALIIEFMSTNRKSRPELIEDEGGHDDCFDWSGPVARRGRVWVDPISHDVLRVDRRLEGPVDVRVPWELQRRYNFPAWIVLERDDQTLRYQTVAFSDPEERVLLPESIESLTVLRSSLQSVRRTDRFGNYRRFLTAGRVIKAP